VRGKLECGHLREEESVRVLFGKSKGGAKFIVLERD
jgi:hypothetical protein